MKSSTRSGSRRVKGPSIKVFIRTLYFMKYKLNNINIYY